MKKIHNFNVILTIFILFLLFLSLLSFNLSYAFNNETGDIEVWERQNIINSINFLESKSNNTEQRANALTEKTEKRSMLIRDFNDNEVYIYMEFNPGGYALYDRTGEFIYERTIEGEGPYIDKSADDKLYYGGPQRYFYKKNNMYINTVTNEEINIQTGIEYTKVNNSVREEKILENKNNINTFAYGDIVKRYLGERRGSDFPGQIYFPLFAYTDWNYQSSFTSKFYPTYDNDVLFANNEMGSCAEVALGLVMQYYDRMQQLYPNEGFVRMVPDDVSNFAYVDTITRSYRDSEGNIVDTTNKNAYKGEYLHQELLSLIHPGVTFPKDKDVFNTTPNQLVEGAKKYFARHNFPDRKLSLHTNDEGALSQICDGNPAILYFKGDVWITGKGEITVEPHAAVAYGATAKAGLFNILTAMEYYVNFGWLKSKEYSSVIVNAGLINFNSSFNVF